MTTNKIEGERLCWILKKKRKHKMGAVKERESKLLLFFFIPHSFFSLPLLIVNQPYALLNQTQFLFIFFGFLLSLFFFFNIKRAIGCCCNVCLFLSFRDMYTFVPRALLTTLPTYLTILPSLVCYIQLFFVLPAIPKGLLDSHVHTYAHTGPVVT